MDGPSRYNVHPKQAGLDGDLLKNKLGLTTQKELDDAETVLLSDAYAHFFNELERGQIDFGISFLFEIHKYFLGTLYAWAGKTRTVDACVKGMSRNHDPMARIIYAGLRTKAL